MVKCQHCPLVFGDVDILDVVVVKDEGLTVGTSDKKDPLKGFAPDKGKRTLDRPNI